MKPQELSLDCEIFEEFREKLNATLNMALKNMIRKGLLGGTVTAKINIELKEHVTDTGEVVYMPEFKPSVSLRIKAEGKIECKEQEGFLMLEDGLGGFVVGTSQISMDELIRDHQLGA